MINIVFNCDNKYAPFLAATILSVVKNTSVKINFYILELEIEEISKNNITHIIKSYGSQVSFIPINKEDLLGFPQTINYISPITYARLNLAKYLPDLSKVIYLDIDILINGDLLDLWNTPIDNYCLAGCIDPYIDSNMEYKKGLGLLSNESYINTGVMLINLNKVKEIDTINKSKVIVDTYKNIKYQDQDIINILFKGKIFLLNSRFNFTLNHKNRIINSFKSSDISLDELEKPSLPIVIYHYVGNVKPWHSRCTQSMTNKYQRNINEICILFREWGCKFDKKPLKIILKNYLNDLKNRYIFKIY